jgi:hypothetical protein
MVSAVASEIAVRLNESVSDKAWVLSGSGGWRLPEAGANASLSGRRAGTAING